MNEDDFFKYYYPFSRNFAQAQLDEYTQELCKRAYSNAINSVPTVVETTVKTVVKTTEVKTVVYTFPELDLD